eukprot:IDg16278t1
MRCNLSIEEISHDQVAFAMIRLRRLCEQGFALPPYFYLAKYSALLSHQLVHICERLSQRDNTRSSHRSQRSEQLCRYVSSAALLCALHNARFLLTYGYLLDACFMYFSVRIIAQIEYEQVSIRDMGFCSRTMSFTHPCPCGDFFRIRMNEPAGDTDDVDCESCERYIVVLYPDRDEGALSASHGRTASAIYALG